MAGALDGIKVLDISRFIAGPYCSMLLADMGADVIKIEKKGSGEDSRGMIPFAGKEGGEKVSLYYTQYNKNKRSITLDFRNQEGIGLLKGLIKKADVLVENFRAGTLDKMGLTKEVLHELNPSLVVTSISGFGQDGPYRDRAAFDCIGQVMGGLMSVTGEEGRDPLLTGTWVADFTTAIYAAFGTVCAVYHQKRTGEGQFLDISLLDSIVSILATAIPNYVETGVVQPRRGNRDNVTGPANLFKTKDGYIYMHAGTDPLFKSLTKVMGQPELNERPEYCTATERMKRIKEVEEIVLKWMADYTTEELENILVEAGIPCSPVMDVAAIVKNPQIKHRDAIVYREYPGVGEIALPGIVVKMDKTKGEIKRIPPALGQNNFEVYEEMLGLTKDEVEKLILDGII
ncbi:MAG TPA: CoA transferase [Anaerovoracaceae bacterium]|nr:CoA transferase [Anaerovoracaceae bacterium]